LTEKRRRRRQRLFARERKHLRLTEKTIGFVNDQELDVFEVDWFCASNVVDETSRCAHDNVDLAALRTSRFECAAVVGEWVGGRVGRWVGGWVGVWVGGWWVGGREGGREGGWVSEWYSSSSSGGGGGARE
jgi:hypothetical protein